MGSQERELSLFLHGMFYITGISATVVNGVQPGPLITAKKVILSHELLVFTAHCKHIKGETFKLNVVNQLTDAKQERGTSIVRVI